MTTDQVRHRTRQLSASQVQIMSSPSSPAVKSNTADTNDTPQAIVELSNNKGVNISKVVYKSPERGSSPTSASASLTGYTGEDEPKLERAAMKVASKVLISLRQNKDNQKHVEESVDTLDLISKGSMTASRKRSCSPDSDTSSLSDVTSFSEPDDGSDDTNMSDADRDTEKTATNSATMSFNAKICAAVARANQTKAHFTPKQAAGMKHRIIPHVFDAERKKPHLANKRDRCAEASLEVQKLPYQSIISLSMPPRPGLIPGQSAPEPDPTALPFGDTEDYHNSMIIHYMDECEMTYTKAAEVYSEKFPRDAVTDEAVRKRHIRSLLRLKMKYGCKDPDAIPRPSKAVLRRGTPRAKKISLIVPVDAAHIPTATQSPIDIPTNPIKFKSSLNATTEKKRKLPPRLFEKALIVAWHDDAKLSWKAIQNKLEDEYKWSLGQSTIEKYYYSTLERVYGMGGKKEKNVEARKEGRGRRQEDGDFGGFVERVVERRMSF